MTFRKKTAINKGIKAAKSPEKDTLKSLVKENGSGLGEKKKPNMNPEKKTAINQEGKAAKSHAKDTLESPTKKNAKKRKLASDDAPKEKKQKKANKEEIKLKASVDESVHSNENDVPKLTVKKTKLPGKDEVQKKKKLKNAKQHEKKKQRDSEGELVSTNEKKPVPKMPVAVFGDTFESLRSHVSEATMKSIESFGFKKLTEVQKKTIPLLLAGRDVRGVSKTGSGKTLAFLIPAIERIRDCQGLSCIILSPTRELALQLHGVVKILAKPHGLTHGIVMGGVKMGEEQPIIKRGVNILVATPGRLLDHLKQTRGFKVQKLRVLVLDEADRILDDGFEKQLDQILRRLPKTRRQSMLFSATVTPKLSAMTLRALGNEYDEVNLVGAVLGASASDNLTQSFLLCPTFQRLIVLYKLLKDCADKKVMVFFSTCESVNFYKKLFNMLKIKVEGIHGRQGQKFRTENYNSFVSSATGTLLCTDIAARGWDIPAVDLIVQYDPPFDVTEYIHRVGRAARREGEKGKAVLFLRDEELPLLQVLKDQGAVLSKYEDIDMFDLDYDVQQTVNDLVLSDVALGQMGTRAYRNFLTSYSVLQPSHVYDRKTIPTKELAKNFGLMEIPEFDFSRIPLHYVAKDLLRKPKPKNSVVFSTKGISKAGGSRKGGKSVSYKNMKKNKKGLVILIDGAHSEKQNEKKKKMKERKKQRKMRNAPTKPVNGVALDAGAQVSKNKKKRPLSGEVNKATAVSIKKIKNKSSTTDESNNTSTVQIKKIRHLKLS